jgi:hypothetical protein
MLIHRGATPKQLLRSFLREDPFNVFGRPPPCNCLKCWKLFGFQIIKDELIVVMS